LFLVLEQNFDTPIKKRILWVPALMGFVPVFMLLQEAWAMW